MPCQSSMLLQTCIGRKGWNFSVPLQQKFLQLIASHSSLPIWREGKDFRQQYQNLISFTQDLFPLLQRGFEKMLGLNMLFICESHRNLDLQSSVHAAFNYIRQTAIALPFSCQPIEANLLDARSMHLGNAQRPQLIITSPPYINVFNYHQNHRAILETIGWDMLQVASSEFGSNRKNRGNRFRTVVQYCLDMEQALHSFWHGLCDNGLMIIVIGRESNVRGVPFYNGQLVKEIAECTGGFQTVTEQERAFINKFGNQIKEDVFVFRKQSAKMNIITGRSVANRHLETALRLTTTQDVSADIADAIRNIESITPSPLFQERKVFKYA